MKKVISTVIIYSLVLMHMTANISPCYGAEEIKIAVMDLKAKQGVSDLVVSSLTDLLCTEILNMGGYDVIGRDDMQAMLEHIADKQLLECDDTKCLAQVGGALGVQQLLSGNIGMIGKTYLINLKLIDIDNAKVMNRVSKEYTGTEAGLIGEIKACVKQVFSKDEPAALAVDEPQQPLVTEPVQMDVKEQISAPKKGFPWLWVGIGAAVLVVGAVVAAAILGGDEELSDLPEPPDLPAKAALNATETAY